MAKILQVLNVDSDGHRVRLDDGRVVDIPHGSGDALSVGDELPPWFHPLRHPETSDPVTIAPVEFLNGPEQVQANILSEIVQPHGGADASSEPSPESGHGDSGTRAGEAE